MVCFYRLPSSPLLSNSPCLKLLSIFLLPGKLFPRLRPKSNHSMYALLLGSLSVSVLLAPCLLLLVFGIVLIVGVVKFKHVAG